MQNKFIKKEKKKKEKKISSQHLCVGHGRQGVVYGGRLGGHGQEGRHPEGHAGRHRVGVQPEGDPGDDDEHAAGHVDGQQIVGELALEGQVHR